MGGDALAKWQHGLKESYMKRDEIKEGPDVMSNSLWPLEGFKAGSNSVV